MTPEIRNLLGGLNGDESTLDAARVLFGEYGLFLRDTHDPGYFSYERFGEEINALPTPYTSRNGGLLVAWMRGVPAGCVAFRVSPDEGPDTCEIKRLYVTPLYRGQGLARLLMTDALEHVDASGYSRVVLDTDSEHMPEALKLYLSLGFREYKPRLGVLAYFERALGGRSKD